MKKAMAKCGLRLFAAVFVLFGTLLGTAARVEAQGLDNMMGQNYNWVSEAEAATILDAQLPILADDLSAFPPGSPGYENALNRLVYYKLILGDLENGLSTKDATNTNLFKVPLENGSQDTAPLTVNLDQLYTNALGLLTN